MASVVSHIIYAQKYLEKYPSREINPDEFMLGCVFPDIRRIDSSIKRKDTHICFDPIDLDFAGLTSFQAGWKFHLYCDMKREEILNKYAFYSLPNAADFWHQPAKGLEDEIIYDDYNNWEKLVLYFNNPPQIDTRISVSQGTFELWFAVVAKYIEKKPNTSSMRIFLSKQVGFGENLDKIAASVDKLRKSGKVIETLKKVKEEIV